MEQGCVFYFKNKKSKTSLRFSGVLSKWICGAQLFCSLMLCINWLIKLLLFSLCINEPVKHVMIKWLYGHFCHQGNTFSKVI